MARAIIATDGGQDFMARAIIATGGGQDFMAWAIIATDGGRGFMARAIIATDGGKSSIATVRNSGSSAPNTHRHDDGHPEQACHPDGGDFGQRNGLAMEPGIEPNDARREGHAPKAEGRKRCQSDVIARPH